MSFGAAWAGCQRNVPSRVVKKETHPDLLRRNLDLVVVLVRVGAERSGLLSFALASLLGASDVRSVEFTVGVEQFLE